MSTVTAAVRRYYDAADVNGFYSAVWGGESIHMGIYLDEREEIASAGRRTTERMADKAISHLGPGNKVLDLGSGYGGPARYLSARFGCQVVALNLSHVQNRRHRETNIIRGAARIAVVTGSFDAVPCPAGHFDVVWSQDALSHADNQTAVLAEAARVLKPDGHLVFTDLMAADGTPADALRPVLARTAADTLPTLGFYRKQLAGLGFGRATFDDYSSHLLTHYRRVVERTRQRLPELVDSVSPAYLDSLLENLPLWVDACLAGHLRWGLFHCDRRQSKQRPSSSGRA